MPTYEQADRFARDFGDMSEDAKQRFLAKLMEFIEDLQAGNGFRPGLRVKGVAGAPGVFEMTWAPDGRATFQYGEPVREGEVHVAWRRVGTHQIFTRP